MNDLVKVEKDGDYTNVLFREQFIGIMDEYDDVYDIAKNVRSTQRDWVDLDQKFFDCGNSELSQAMNSILNPIIEAEVVKSSDTALRQGFLEAVLNTSLEFHFGYEDGREPAMIIESEIDGITARRELKGTFLYEDGQCDYGLHLPEIVEENDDYIILKFRKTD